MFPCAVVAIRETASLKGRPLLKSREGLLLSSIRPSLVAEPAWMC
jgi:hypothetical protein